MPSQYTSSERLPDAGWSGLAGDNQEFPTPEEMRSMRGAVIYAPGDVRVEDRPEPTIVEPTDAILRLPATCICGSDLWPYRGADPIPEPFPIGHEYVGIVEEVGSSVSTVRPGQFVGWVVLRLGQHLRDMSSRVPDLVRPTSAGRPGWRAGAAGPGPAGRRHPGRHPGGTDR